MPSTKVKTSVSLSQDVVDYLDGLARASERDRSWVVNALARYHATNYKRPDQAPPLDPAPSVIGLKADPKEFVFPPLHD